MQTKAAKDSLAHTQALIAGLQGFVLGGLTAGISNKIGNLSNVLARAISHGIVSGVRAIIQGGNFLSGFLSSFASTYLQPIGRALAKGSYYGRAFFSAMVGGTVSVIGGGKFANGAVTSAFQFMFNDWLHDFKKEVYALAEQASEEVKTLAKALEVNTDPMDIFDRKPPEGWHNGRWDAVRHCVGGCMIRRKFGYTKAWIVGTGHEMENFYDSPNTQTYRENIMDLHNNEVGYNLGAGTDPCLLGCLNSNTLIISPNIRNNETIILSP